MVARAIELRSGAGGYTEAALGPRRPEPYVFYGEIQYSPGKWTFGAGAQCRLNKDLGLEVDKVESLSADWGDYRADMAILQLRYAIAGPYPLSR